MDEFWAKLWESFWRMCETELQHVSVTSVIVVTLIGAGFVHVACMIYVKVKKQSISLRRELLIMLALSYVGFILQITLIGREPRVQPRVIDTNWLWIDRNMDQSMTDLLNIILFIPYGALLVGLQMNKNSIRQMVMLVSYCFLSSLLIESLQYITNRGYFDMVDIEANILGGLIGGLLVSLSVRIGTLILRRTEV